MPVRIVFRQTVAAPRSATSPVFVHRTGWALTVPLLATLLLPRVVTEGMFPDGLCYASLARNLAEGRGSFWQPFFSTSYWLPYNTGPVYYENLPLTVWLQSLFFRAFGDYWWTEKVYCVALTVATAALLVALWRRVVVVNLRPFAWLPVLLWYTLPQVIWTNPNNQLDATMAFFALAAVYAALVPSVGGAVLAGTLTLGAVLAKSPVGLFPLVTPLLAAWVFKHQSWRNAAGQTALLVGTLLGLLAVVCLFDEPRAFFAHYLDQQLLSALAGRRENVSEGWTARLSLLPWLVRENAPLLVLGLLLLWLTRTPLRKVRRLSTAARFFYALALGASLPIAVSPKQDALYLIPSLPLYALGAAAVLAPVLARWSRSLTDERPFRWAQLAMGVGLVGVLGYTVAEAGRPAREADVLTDLTTLSRFASDGAKIGVCPATMPDFVTHCYFQRYHRWELTTNPSKTTCYAVDAECGPAFTNFLEKNGFVRQPVRTERYAVWVRKP